MPSADVVIVGNGIIGLAVAWEVVQRGQGTTVAVIGPPDRPGAASAAAGAMLNCFGEVTQRTFDHPAAQAKFQIAKQALDAWPDWLARLREAADMPELGKQQPDGTYVVLSSKAPDQVIANFEAIRAAVQAHAEPHQDADAADIAGLCPDVHARPRQILHLPREGALDARQVLAALERALRRHGVDLVPQQARRLEMSNDQVTGVQLHDGEVMAAGTVVLAAGSQTQQFIEQLPPGLVPPMLHGAGLAVETQRERFPGFDSVVRTPNQAGACGVHLVPLDGQGREYVGATNIVSFHPIAGPRIGVCASLLKNAYELFDRRLAYSHVRSWLFGRRPVTLDGLPLIGRAPSCGAVFATGTFRDGFHSAPVIAAHLAQVILGPAPAAGILDHLTPERAPLQRRTLTQSIQDWVDHEIDTSVAYGIQTPYFIDPELISKRFQQTAVDLYEQMHQPVALAPEILMALTNEPEAAKAQITPYLHHAHARYGATPATL
ncbi:NAD(P)/FAD-dependent oxidoreductase [Streptomyces sp. NPDC054866]